MITSWAPLAGSDSNSSGWPRPDFPSQLGSAASDPPASPAPVSAGYRLGTTRTVQPVELAGPPPGRTA